MQRIAATLVIVMTCSLLVSCSRQVYQSGGLTQADLPRIAELMRVAFPPSTEIVGAKWESALDDAVYVKVRMAQRDVQGFCASGVLAAAPIRSAHNLPQNPALPWWDYEELAAYRAWEVNWEGDQWLNVSLGSESEDVAVAYLFWCRN